MLKCGLAMSPLQLYLVPQRLCTSFRALKGLRGIQTCEKEWKVNGVSITQETVMLDESKAHRLVFLIGFLADFAVFAALPLLIPSFLLILLSVRLLGLSFRGFFAVLVCRSIMVSLRIHVCASELESRGPYLAQPSLYIDIKCAFEQMSKYGFAHREKREGGGGGELTFTLASASSQVP